MTVTLKYGLAIVNIMHERDGIRDSQIENVGDRYINKTIKIR